LGEFVRNGIDLAVYDINKEGDSIKNTLVVEYADSKNDPKEGLAAFQKAMLADPAVVLVAMSSVAGAIAPIADERRVPLFATMVSSKDATENHPFMFRLFINADIDARLMATFAAKKGMLRIAVISVNDEMGASFSSVFQDTLAALGGQVVLHENFDKSATDFRDVAAKARSTPSDALYLLGYDKNLGQLARSLREQGVTQPFLSIATISQEPVMNTAGSAIDNTYFTSVRFDADAPGDELTMQFVNNYLAKYGKKPTYFSAFAYDAVMLIQKAIEIGGSSREQIVASLSSLENVEGVSGNISFGGKRDARFDMVIKKIEQGKVLVEEDAHE